MKKINDNNLDAQKEERKRAPRASGKETKISAKKVTDRNEKIISDIDEEIFDEKKAALDISKKLTRSVKTKKKFVVEHYGKQVSEDFICEKLTAKLIEDGFMEDIKTLNIYYKVEEETAYCVVNNGDPIVVKVFE